MVKKLLQNKIEVKKSSMHGYGVFAKKKIHKGEKIEECYFILSRRGGDKGLEDFYFDAKGKYAVFLGYGSIYNHSEDPSADYSINMTKRIATIKAMRDIPKGKEIFISYGKGWFRDRGLEPRSEPRKKKK
jgi:SET domain-containing protein